MKIIRAEHLGMCFGVRDAIALAESKAKQQPITILGDLVHNENVVQRLQSQGVVIERDPAKVRTPAAMITAHGASDKSKARARSFGFEVFEGTCPLVQYAHRSVARLAAEGYYPVVIGKPEHVEVVGLTEDLSECTVVSSPADIEKLPLRDRYGVASQTTQPIDRVLYLLDVIRDRFPQAEVRFIDTVCQPTKQRQRAALDLARQSDVVIVVGGRNSNNTRELVQTSSRCCDRVHHVEGPAQLQPEWFEGVEVIGLTAGTSTPDEIIDAVEAGIRDLVASRLANYNYAANL
jgi:4-hydroxy-3-methylbut-2-enyl diphosphate reductase